MGLVQPDTKRVRDKDSRRLPLGKTYSSEN